jgi:hypothetical protein
MFGLNNLFWYYKKSVRSNVQVKDPLEGIEGDLPAEEFFGTYVIISTLFLNLKINYVFLFPLE